MVVVGECRLSGEQEKPSLIDLVADPQAINVGKMSERIQVKAGRSTGNAPAQLDVFLPLRGLRNFL